jgi:hypothetical protein
MTFFFHQVNVGIGLLTTMRNDLQNVIAVCEQVKKPTNYLRSVMSDLMKGKANIPNLFTEILLCCEKNNLSVSLVKAI